MCHEHELVADLEVAARTLTGRELDHALRAALADNAPGRNLPCKVHDSQISIQEHDVDREAHERRVHGGCGPEEHPLAPGELLPAQQAAHARPRRTRYETPLAHELAVGPLKRNDLH